MANLASEASKMGGSIFRRPFANVKSAMLAKVERAVLEVGTLSESGRLAVQTRLCARSDLRLYMVSKVQRLDLNWAIKLAPGRSNLNITSNVYSTRGFYLVKLKDVASFL